MSNTQKAHYIINELKGFQNFYGDRVTSITQEVNKLIINFRINPSLNENNYDLIKATTTYNLNTNKFKTSVYGEGSRKYNSQVKQSIQTILNNAINQAQLKQKGDESDALSETINYYYEQLKQLLPNNRQLFNEFYYKASHECNTVIDVEKVFNQLVSDNESMEGGNKMLTENEKEVIAARLNVSIDDLNKTVLTCSELKEPKILSLINEYAEAMVNDVLLQNENIDITTRPISQWNSNEKSLYRFYISNIKTGILDGTHSQTVDTIRNEYKSYKDKLNHHIQVEKSFELPDHEVPLSIFIERSSKSECILRQEHEIIIKNAIEKGLAIPENVMKDYKHLEHDLNKSHTGSNKSFTNVIQSTKTKPLALNLQYFSQTQKIKVNCSKCDGKGYLPEFAAFSKGICFRCKGKGYFLMTQAQHSKLLEQQKEMEAQLTDHWNKVNDCNNFKFKVGDWIRQREGYYKDELFKIIAIEYDQYVTDKGVRIGVILGNDQFVKVE